MEQPQGQGKAHPDYDYVSELRKAMYGLKQVIKKMECSTASLSRLQGRLRLSYAQQRIKLYLISDLAFSKTKSKGTWLLRQIILVCLIDVLKSGSFAQSIVIA